MINLLQDVEGFHRTIRTKKDELFSVQTKQSSAYNVK